MRESMLRYTLHVRVASKTQKIQSNDGKDNTFDQTYLYKW